MHSNPQDVLSVFGLVACGLIKFGYEWYWHGFHHAWNLFIYLLSVSLQGFLNAIVVLAMLVTRMLEFVLVLLFGTTFEGVSEYLLRHV